MHATDPHATYCVVAWMVLPCDLDAVKEARACVRKAADVLRVDSFAAETVVDELVANAAKHVGRGRIHLTVLSCASCWVIEVADELGDVLPQIPEPEGAWDDGESETGRGLRLAVGFAQVEVHRIDRATKCVSATFALECA